jgi:hypothetical protein
MILLYGETGGWPLVMRRSPCGQTSHGSPNFQASEQMAAPWIAKELMIRNSITLDGGYQSDFNASRQDV